MIIPKNLKLTNDQLAEVKRIVEEFGCKIQVIKGAVQSIYAMLGDERHEQLINRIEELDYIECLDTIQSPHRLLDIQSELKNHKMIFGDRERRAFFGDIRSLHDRSERPEPLTRRRKHSKRWACMQLEEVSGSCVPTRIRIKGTIKS